MTTPIGLILAQCVSSFFSRQAHECCILQYVLFAVDIPSIVFDTPSIAFNTRLSLVGLNVCLGWVSAGFGFL